MSADCKEYPIPVVGEVIKVPGDHNSMIPKTFTCLNWDGIQAPSQEFERYGSYNNYRTGWLFLSMTNSFKTGKTSLDN